MNKQQKYLKKRKEKELKNRGKKLFAAKEAATARQAQKKEYLSAKEYNRNLVKLEKLEKKAEDIMSKLPEDTRSKIEHNIEILKALEEEHKKELDQKNELNKKLEEQGHFTLDEKIRALSDKNPDEVPEIMADDPTAWNESEEVVFDGPPTFEVSDDEVAQNMEDLFGSDKKSK
jgi:hypothetical protein